MKNLFHRLALVSATILPVVSHGAAGETLVHVIGDLPPGKSVTITFEVDVPVLPPGVTAVANQALVGADGLPPVISDDPDTPAVPNDPTVTPVSANLDFGDAPDPAYPTRADNGGAYHHIADHVILGVAIDDDVDGQPLPPGFGDDFDGSDDEDGVRFLADPLVAGENVAIEVQASVEGVLNAWVDFDANGSWGDHGEQVFTDEALSAGINNLFFDIPPSAVPVFETYARFRFSTASKLSYTGPAPDGEVEDYALRIEVADFGDAPDPAYATLRASGGARHVLGGGLFLGGWADADLDGQPSPGADGDDATGGDEDGVFFAGPLIQGQTGFVDVLPSGVGFLDAWIDFDGSGVWGDAAGEQIAFSELLFFSPWAIFFPVPVTPYVGPTYARFRFSSLGGLAPVGLARDGEVEDHAVVLYQPGPVGPLAITNLTVNHEGNISVSWESESNVIYRLQATGDGARSWTNIGPHVLGPANRQFDPEAVPHRNYRVVAPYAP